MFRGRYLVAFTRERQLVLRSRMVLRAAVLRIPNNVAPTKLLHRPPRGSPRHPEGRPPPTSRPSLS